jgi:hypothetical protein
MGLDQRPMPLVEPGSPEHALFVLTWLHAFSAAHAHLAASA